jgi:predicted Zn-dependent protease
VVPDAVRPHYMLARMHYRAGQEGGGRAALERARVEFVAGLARDPRVHPYYHGIYGALLIDLGRFDEAVNVLGAVVEARPGDALALTNLGVALRSLGRLPEARAVGERAVRADPGYTKGWLQLAQTREAVGDRAAAAEAWRAVSAAWPNYGPARRKLKELEGAR